MFTAEEARAVAGNSKELDRFVNRILRRVKSEAKKGRYSLKFYYFDQNDPTFLRHACNKLKVYGYNAFEDTWLGYICVSWAESPAKW